MSGRSDRTTHGARSWWGWGWESDAVTGGELDGVATALIARFPDASPPVVVDVPDPEGLELPAVRVVPPDSLSGICKSDPRSRASHTYGKSFRDVVRALSGDVSAAPDLVARPGNEWELVDLLDWCSRARVAAVPFGGGSSVVGGVEGGTVRDRFEGVVSIDLTRLSGVEEIDPVSRAARIRAGTYGPDLEDELRPTGLTLRHFPQSFEHSTLGGWIATRSGGHYATNYTHIDDFVESLRVVTPTGTVETRRVPGSGAGPSPDRLFLGSEGVLGVITEAWVRLQQRPRHRAATAVRFPTFDAGVRAARAVVQAGLFPSNCRLLDPAEAAGMDPAGRSVLLVGFESPVFAVDGLAAAALECCLDHGGVAPSGVGSSSGDGAAGTWRRAFFKAPYLRDAVARLGWIAETFETAVSWSGFDTLHGAVVEAVSGALDPAPAVSCRFTHVYPDGPAPYFTVVAPSRSGRQLADWQRIKDAASEAILAAGGTITHHHAVGRDHRPWYDRQRPDLFAASLEAVKDRLDPAGVLNPGVLVG
ncbi:MAG: FAD-binding oxidoreductase [Acidimicrobiales bacterium]